ncbi:MAG: hypothetical protein V7727_18615 [Sneathiella sp.]
MMETLKGLRYHNAEVLAICYGCHRDATLKREELIETFGESMAVPMIAQRLKCKKCGSKDVKTRPKFPDVISNNLVS